MLTPVAEIMARTTVRRSATPRRRLSAVRAAATDTAAGVGAAPKVLVRADSAFYGYRAVRAAIRGGADVSVTVPWAASQRRDHC
jgi:hypothetical protein